ncbi:MAG: outer membrane protein/peptidoglycan-associated protein [Flavipsychrobacter sp.]|nr:outer membrane protein/peptidoglycan-associated protein [Flavipsychrobacter sp.]
MKMVKVTGALLVMVMMFSACNSSKCYMKRFKKKAGKEVGTSNVSMRGDSVRVVYPEVTIFDFNKDEVKPEAKMSIQRLSTLLNKYDRVNFVINGYTDNVGTEDVNLSLSQKRADNTKAVFQADGVSPARMQTNGLGASKPVMSNSTDAGRQANRRVEFLMYDKKAKKK